MAHRTWRRLKTPIAKGRMQGKGDAETWSDNRRCHVASLPTERRFCRTCLKSANQSRCCGVPTVEMDIAACVPRRRAQRRQWDNFFKIYPSLRTEN